jgi:hypothetical protein
VRRALTLGLALATVGCGGPGGAPRVAPAPPPHPTGAVSIVKRAESPGAIVCLREARLLNVRQMTPTSWRGMTHEGLFVVVRRRASAQLARRARAEVPGVRGGVAKRYVVTGGLRVQDRGRGVRAVLACLRSLGGG